MKNGTASSPRTPPVPWTATESSGSSSLTCKIIKILFMEKVYEI